TLPPTLLRGGFFAGEKVDEVALIEIGQTGHFSLLRARLPVETGELGATALRDPPPGCPRRASAIREAAATIGDHPRGVPTNWSALPPPPTVQRGGAATS